MSKAVLVDLNRCVGCRSCQVACKAWHDNPGESTQCSGSYENPPQLSGDTWTLIKFDEVEDDAGKLHWVFTKRQCMHCQHPACVSACPVTALHKRDDGPVVYDAEKCIGCRYCMMACPFHIPKIHWDRSLPLIKKCDFCADRIDEGLEPACVKACPTDALVFGERDELIADAEARISAQPKKYVNHIYGQHEAGGTSWMYLSPVDFDTLWFPQSDSLGTEPVPALSDTVAEVGTPSMLAGVAALLAGIYWATKRRAERMSQATAGRKEEG
jgi:formate dehydrogenase iron-sulfur subunit